MELYAQVAIDRGNGQVLTYSIDKSIDSENLVGRRVKVPLRNSAVVGIVLSITGIAPSVKTKDILESLDVEQFVPSDILDLTEWISDYYMCEWGEAIRAALPSGLMKTPQLKITWMGSEFEGEWPNEVLRDIKLRNLARKIVASHSTTLKKLAQFDKYPHLTDRLRVLESCGLISLQERGVLDPSQIYSLEIVQAVKDAPLKEIPSNAKARQRLWNTLLDCGGELSWTELRSKAKVNRPILVAMIKMGYVTTRKESKLEFARGFDPRKNSDTLIPSKDQEKAISEIKSGLDKGKFRTFLLGGSPGSGKTKVYSELIKHAVKNGKGVLLLVPEISLTPQVVARIRDSIDSPVVILHSALTKSQRIAAWQAVRKGSATIVVGPRSAVFAPVNNLGLVVIDEEHEESFKQMESSPRYHARDVALMRAKKQEATVVLVSATPSLESIRLLETGKTKYFELTSRFGAGWPEISIVDRRREGGKAPYIGTDLSRAIQEQDSKNEGTVLMITRRGYSPVLVCGKCGERVTCTNCDISMTVHTGTGSTRMKCHLCGFSTRVPGKCPECGSEKLRQAGAGTQRIEEELLRRFPDLTPIRMDQDTTKRSRKHEEILRSFASGESQLLLGTQMVAKGHDFAHVTLVGVVNADTSLFLPDFRANEKTFRLLVQAAGRAGRGDKAGKVIIQTLDPENAVFQYLAKPDIFGFLEREAQLRKTFLYPPYSRMIVITLASNKNERALEAAEAVAKEMRKVGDPLLILGPAPAMVARKKRKYRHRIVVRIDRKEDPSGSYMRKQIRGVKKHMKLPAGVSLIIDVDPLIVN